MKLNEKYNELINYLKELDSVMLAFSGGVDSTFLLKAAKDALGSKVKAVTVSSPYIPKWEIEEAKELTAKLGIEHEILEVEISPEIAENPANRCYLCKLFIFSTIKKLAADQGFNYVIDGSNMDDLGDYRPGLVALRELEIISPMLKVELSKNEIRQLSKERNLPTWDKPAYACLLTRIPYGDALKTEDFRMIEEAEKYMINLGFRAVRVRKHGNLARIEVSKDKREKLFDIKLFDEISLEFKNLGFEYVTLDMQGYRMGSFNSEIKDRRS